MISFCAGRRNREQSRQSGGHLSPHRVGGTRRQPRALEGTAVGVGGSGRVSVGRGGGWGRAGRPTRRGNRQSEGAGQQGPAGRGSDGVWLRPPAPPLHTCPLSACLLAFARHPLPGSSLGPARGHGAARDRGRVPEEPAMGVGGDTASLGVRRALHRAPRAGPVFRRR